MLSVLRTPIRHLHITFSILAVIGVILAGLVVQKLVAGEATISKPEQVIVAARPESHAPRARQQKAGPEGRALPWVRWEYIP